MSTKKSKFNLFHLYAFKEPKGKVFKIGIQFTT